MKKIYFLIFTALSFLLLVGCESNITVDGKEKMSALSNNYITDENYEPTEKDFLEHTMTMLQEADKHKYGNLDNYFINSANDAPTPVAWIVEDYETEDFEYTPEETKITYDITNKKYVSYDNEVEGDVLLEPKSISESVEGVKWKEFHYDTYIEFEFDLKRTVKNGSKENVDSYHISGSYTPAYFGSEARWFLSSLYIEKQ